MRLYEQYLEDVGFCNCGTPRDTLEWTGKALTLATDRGPFENWKEWWEDYKIRRDAFFGTDYNIYMFFCYWMNDKGFAEHGGGVGGSWLTQWGKKWLEGLPAALADMDAYYEERNA